MDLAGFRIVKDAVEVKPTMGGYDQRMGTQEPPEGEDIAFIDIETCSPASVLNMLHAANLLATPKNVTHDDGPR